MSHLFYCWNVMYTHTIAEQRIADAVSDALGKINIAIVRVRILGKSDVASKVVEILVERIDDQKISITDCKKCSNITSTILDMEEIITDYTLEVSSAGIERPLVKPEDFIRFTGHVVQIKLQHAIEESKKFTGTITQADKDSVKIRLDKSTKELSFTFDNIKDAKLVLTDELFRKILKSK